MKRPAPGTDGRIGEGGSVLAHAFDGLKHDFSAFANEDHEAETVALGHADGLFETHAVDPEGEGFFDFIDEEVCSDLHVSKKCNRISLK